MSDEEKKSSLGDQISSLGGVELGFVVHKRVLRWSAYLALVILAILVVSLMILKPQWQELMELRQETAGEAEEVERYEEKIAQLDDFEIEFSQYQSWIGQVLPQDNNLGLILAGLRQAANDAGVELISYAAGGGKAVDDEAQLSSKSLGSFGLEVYIAGDRASIQRFLEEMDQSLPLKNVQQFGVSQGSGLGSLKVRLGLVVYYLKQGVGEAKVTASLRLFDERDEELLSQLATYEIWQPGEQPTGSEQGGNENLFGL